EPLGGDRAAARVEMLHDGKADAWPEVASLVDQSSGDRPGRLESDPDGVGFIPLEVDARGEGSIRLEDHDGLGLAGIGVDKGELRPGQWLAGQGLQRLEA